MAGMWEAFLGGVSFGGFHLKFAECSDKRLAFLHVLEYLLKESKNRLRNDGNRV